MSKTVFPIETFSCGKIRPKVTIGNRLYVYLRPDERKKSTKEKIPKKKHEMKIKKQKIEDAVYSAVVLILYLDIFGQ